jgi:hypothetical protein
MQPDWLLETRGAAGQEAKNASLRLMAKQTWRVLLDLVTKSLLFDVGAQGRNT